MEMKLVLVKSLLKTYMLSATNAIPAVTAKKSIGMNFKGSVSEQTLIPEALCYIHTKALIRAKAEVFYAT
jgi:acyl-CoA hydrolase